MDDTSDAAEKLNLTDREQDILEGLANGWSAKQVARLLDIAPRTVEKHIEHMLLKMHAQNTAHMIGRAFSCGALKCARSSVARDITTEVSLGRLPGMNSGHL